MDEEDLFGYARARKIDFLILGIEFARKSVETVEELLAEVERVVMHHANFTAAQEAFADEARLQIESMTEGE